MRPPTRQSPPRRCRSVRSTNSACSLPSSAFILTYSAARLSLFSENTLDSMSEIPFLTAARLFNSASDASGRCLSRFCNAQFRYASHTSRPPRRTTSLWTACPAALWIVSPPLLSSYAVEFRFAAVLITRGSHAKLRFLASLRVFERHSPPL